MPITTASEKKNHLIGHLRVHRKLLNCQKVVNFHICSCLGNTRSRKKANISKELKVWVATFRYSFLWLSSDFFYNRTLLVLFTFFINVLNKEIQYNNRCGSS